MNLIEVSHLDQFVTLHSNHSNSPFLDFGHKTSNSRSLEFVLHNFLSNHNQIWHVRNSNRNQIVPFRSNTNHILIWHVQNSNHSQIWYFRSNGNHNLSNDNGNPICYRNQFL
jgi:hypothetical protein